MSYIMNTETPILSHSTIPLALEPMFPHGVLPFRMGETPVVQCVATYSQHVQPINSVCAGDGSYSNTVCSGGADGNLVVIEATGRTATPFVPPQ